MLAVGAALTAAQARFLPFGNERDQPPARRTVLAALSFTLIVLFITAAQVVLPAYPTVAAVSGAVLAVLLLKAVRTHFSSDQPSATHKE
jgi:hypothetical protein